MVQKLAKKVEPSVEPDEVSENGRKPDYTVLLRQQPQRGSDGKLYRSKNMTVVGAAWKTEKLDNETGEMVEYIGIKAHIKFDVGDEGLLLRTFREKK